MKVRESTVASHIRLDAAYQGVDLWRNNVGAFQDETGRWIRYGLCNDSPKTAKYVKSSDYIGMTPITITPDMLGKTVAVFTAVETKPSDWKYNPSDQRSAAQNAFHEIVKRAGGFAGFARTVEEFRRIIGR